MSSTRVAERLLLWLHADHPDVPLIVTENGAAHDDRLGPTARS
jgi:hypothetical protein